MLLLVPFLWFVSAQPPAPFGLQARADDGQAFLSWSPPGGAEIINTYTICVTSGVPVCQNVGGSVTTQTRTGLTNMVNYTFTVKATSSFGTGPDSAPSAIFTPRRIVTWVGTISASLWSTPTNWSPQQVPDVTNVVAIPNGAVPIALDVNAAVYGVTSSGSARIECVNKALSLGYFAVGSVLTLAGGGSCELRLGGDGALGTGLSGTVAWSTGWSATVLPIATIRVDGNVLLQGNASLQIPFAFGAGTMTLNNGAEIDVLNANISLGNLVLGAVGGNNRIRGSTTITMLTLRSSPLFIDDGSIATISSVVGSTTSFVYLGSNSRVLLSNLEVASSTNISFTGVSSSQIWVDKLIQFNDVGCGCCGGGCNPPNLISLLGSGVMTFGEFDGSNSIVEWNGNGGGAHNIYVAVGWNIVNSANNTLLVRSQARANTPQLIYGEGNVINNGNCTVTPTPVYTIGFMEIRTSFQQSDSGSLFIATTDIFTVSGLADFRGVTSGSGDGLFVVANVTRVWSDLFSPTVLQLNSNVDLWVSPGTVVQISSVIGYAGGDILLQDQSVVVVETLTINGAGANVSVIGTSNSSAFFLTKLFVSGDVGCGCCGGGCGAANVLSLAGKGVMTFGLLSGGSNVVEWNGNGGGAHNIYVAVGWNIVNSANNTLLVRSQARANTLQLIYGEGSVINNGIWLLNTTSTYTICLAGVRSLWQSSTAAQLQVPVGCTMWIDGPGIRTQVADGLVNVIGSLRVGTGFLLGDANITGQGCVYCGSICVIASEATQNFGITCVGDLPGNCTFPLGSLNSVVGTGMSSTPTCTGSPFQFSISPPLSDGLAFNTSTGTISGAALVAGRTTYNISASNFAGSSVFSLVVSIASYPCPGGFYCPLGQPPPKICSPNYYCPNNSITQTPCPEEPRADCPLQSALPICRTGFLAPLCDKCASIFFGPNCTSCPIFRGLPCNGGVCDGAGTMSGNGNCTCLPGWSGKNCEICAGNSSKNWKPDCSGCASGYFGNLCQNECSCLGDCDDGFKGEGRCLCASQQTNKDCARSGGSCNDTSGVCTCISRGSYGVFCEESGLEEAVNAGVTAGVLLPLYLIPIVLLGLFMARKDKDNEFWQDQESTVFKKTALVNLPFYTSQVYTTITLCAFALQHPIPWHRSIEPLQTGFEATLFVINAKYFYGAVVFSFILALCYALVLVPFYWKDGILVQKIFESSNTWIAYLIYPASTIALLGTMLYSSMVSAFFRALSCTYTEPGRAPYLTADSSILCWTPAHDDYIACAILGLLIALPTILITKPKIDLRSNKKQQIFVKPNFALLLLICQTVMAAVSAFCSLYPLPIVFATAICEGAILVMSLRNPIYPSALNVFCTTGYALTFWMSVCAIIAAIIDDTDNAGSIAVFFVGLLLAFLTVFAKARGVLKHPLEGARDLARSFGVAVRDRAASTRRASTASSQQLP